MTTYFGSVSSPPSWDNLPVHVKTSVILSLVDDVNILDDRCKSIEERIDFLEAAGASRASREYDEWQMSMGDDL